DLARTLWHGTWVDIECLAPPPPLLIDAVRSAPGVAAARLEGTRLAVQVEGEERIPEAVRTVVEHGGQGLRVTAREHTLEEIYFELQGEPARQPALVGGEA